MAGYSPERAMREFLRRGGRDQTRPRRPGPPGRRAAPRAAAAAQPRRDAPGDQGAARARRARGAQAAGPRRRPGRRRPGAARDAAGEPAAQHRRRGERAGVVRLAEPGGPRGLREDQGPARPGAARPAVRRHEAGARERHRRGPRGDQRDARPTSTSCSRSGTAGEDIAGGLRRVHGQARGLLPGEPAEPRRAPRRDGGPRRRRAADAELDVGRAARGADAALAAGVRLARR